MSVNETSDPGQVCCVPCNASIVLNYRAIMTYARGSFYSIGIISNCLAFVVLHLMTLGGSSILYLKMLAVADCVNCLTGLFGREMLFVSTSLEYLHYNHIYQQYKRHVYLYVDAIFQMTTTTSSWLLFALSLDRYVAIRFPLSARNICTIRNAVRVSVAIWILTFIFDFPTIWDLETYFRMPGQPCKYVVQRKLLLKNKQYALYYDFVFGKIVLKFIPGLIVLGCNVHMMMLVRLAARLRHKLQQIDVKDEASTNSKQGRQITLTILALNIVFMVEYGMSLINTFIPAILPDGYTYRPYHSGQLLHAINAMINLFVYLGIRKGFGETLVWFLSCRRFGKRV
ncbi:FMRFamide receptor-like [Tubulanus polymorphus]|uniref:FMRFamide receptor-like n=1 Tax=Tubulanus polymorphus TaxID=672921 RepID=UPI003DA63AFB